MKKIQNIFLAIIGIMVIVLSCKKDNSIPTPSVDCGCANSTIQAYDNHSGWLSYDTMKSAYLITEFTSQADNYFYVCSVTGIIDSIYEKQGGGYTNVEFDGDIKKVCANSFCSGVPESNCAMIALTSIHEVTKVPCNKDDSNARIMVNNDSVLLSSCKLQNINQNQEIVNLIINSFSDYKKYVVGPTDTIIPPAIDFGQYTVLAGRMQTANDGHIVSQSVTKRCDEYTFNVNFADGIATISTDVFYFYIIPKTLNANNIKFNILYKY